MNRFFAVFRSEFVSQFTPGRAIGMFFAIAIPLIGPLAGGAVDHGLDTEGWERNTWMQLGRVFSEGVLYTIIFRLINVLKDGSTLDKNRVSYLTHSKHKVLGAKMLSDTLQFLMTVSVTLVAGTIIILMKNDGKVNAEFYERSIIFLLSMTALYTLTATMMRFFQYTIHNKLFRGIAIGLSVAVTVVAYVVLSICLGVIKEDAPVYDVNGVLVRVRPIYTFQEWVQNNTYVAFIPFINVIMIPQVLYGGVAMWETIPMFVYSAAFIGIVWRKLATASKEFLCA